MAEVLVENNPGTANAAKPSEVTPEALRIYYERLFPSRDFCRWLSYREDDPVGKAADKGGSFLFRREFSFTLPGDIYCRYLSFHGQHDFRKALLDRVPDKIDIGAVFNIPPTNYQQFGLTGGSGGGFQPQQRELVFDIDMDDYDEVRNCCTGSNVCKLCWTFIACAVRILNKALRDDFGFKHILFVFSGRRGVHCWVCDEVARKLSNEQRSAVAEYLQLLNGGRCKYIRSSTQQRHPHVRRGIEICRKYLEIPEVDGGQRFISGDLASPQCGLLEGQKLLEAPAGESDAKNLTQKIVNAAIPASDPVGRAEAKSFLSSKRSSKEVWRWVTSRCANPIVLDEVALEMAYPRLDINVSKQMNHLLKAPFCIHPKTGRVCVPIIDVEKPESFNPLSVPAVAELIEELAARKGDSAGDSEKQTTRLSKYLAYFKKFVDGVEGDILGDRRDVEMEF